MLGRGAGTALMGGRRVSSSGTGAAGGTRSLPRLVCASQRLDESSRTIVTALPTICLEASIIMLHGKNRRQPPGVTSLSAGFTSGHQPVSVDYHLERRPAASAVAIRDGLLSEGRSHSGLD